MKIEEQVLSIEQMKHLQELGVDTSDASMCWLRYDFGGVVKQYVEINDVKWHEWSRATPYPTYTIGDLIEKLPVSINRIQERKILIEGEYTEVRYTNGGDYCPLFYSRSLFIDLLYNLLCEVAENHKELLEVKK